MADGEFQRDMGYLLGQTARWLRALLAEELRFHGLDDSAYIVLYYMRDANGEVSTADLAARIEMPAEEMTSAARLLERDGWATGKPDPKDRGSRILTMTPKAAAVLPVLTDAAHWSIERALNGFTEEEIAQLTDFLQRMQANLR